MIQYLANLPVLKRVIPSIIKKLKISNITFNYENLIFKLDLRYLIDRRFYLTKNYDNSKIQLFIILINKFKILNFLDLGSCWGIYSLRIAKKNPKTQILAFDVFEKNCSRLKEMREINNLNNIKIFSMALGDSKKEVQSPSQTAKSLFSFHRRVGKGDSNAGVAHPQPLGHESYQQCFGRSIFIGVLRTSKDSW